MIDSAYENKDFSDEMQEQSEETKTCGVKVWIGGEKSGLGPGGYALCQTVAAEGSVKKACAIRGLSYSKGWKIINGMENTLGFRIIERQQGGASGGEAHLTEQGKRLMELYKIYEEKVEQAAKTLFEEVFENSELF